MMTVMMTIMVMKKRVYLAGAAVVLVAATVLSATLSSVSASAQSPPATAPEVKIDNFSFGPATLTVAAGTTVTWINRDDIPHNVVSTANMFKSKVVDTDEKFSYTFAKPGTFPYFCSIHPKMTGQVVVQ